ncbi:AAA family ATPase [Psychroserpens jangbogonensis]|uniref:AAA family ATPase n=1 Tax=Psychroserpens jangbogonensis TaxID=1484460 RepID=UPI00053D133E|nr:AAA family ATPase [Psychroserpens jangbogonensis]
MANLEELNRPEKKSPYQAELYSDLQKRNIEPPTKIIGDLIYKNEVSLLFGYKGLGKSIFTWQIGLAVAKGESLDLGNGTYFQNDCEPMTVMYFDYELKDTQVKNRLGTLNVPDNLIRITLARGSDAGSSPKEVFDNIKKVAKEYNAKFIIIDNISKINDIDETNGLQIKQFLSPLMDLAKYDGYTVLVIGHTTQVGGDMLPLQDKHLFGSSKIPNEVDALIGIGRVNNDDTKEFYIKQLKTRISEEVYGANNVIKTRIELNKHEVPMYVSDGFSKEYDLLSGTSLDTERAPLREFYTLCSLYYRSRAKAYEVLKEFGHEVSRGTVYNNYDAFKGVDPTRLKELEKLDADTLKEMVESKSPYSSECLPNREGHNPVDNNSIPF